MVGVGEIGVAMWTVQQRCAEVDFLEDRVDDVPGIGVDQKQIVIAEALHEVTQNGVVQVVRGCVERAISGISQCRFLAGRERIVDDVLVLDLPGGLGRRNELSNRAIVQERGVLEPRHELGRVILGELAISRRLHRWVARRFDRSVAG